MLFNVFEFASQDIDLPQDSTEYPFKRPRVDPFLYQVAPPPMVGDDRAQPASSIAAAQEAIIEAQGEC